MEKKHERKELLIAGKNLDKRRRQWWEDDGVVEVECEANILIAVEVFPLAFLHLLFAIMP